MINSQRRGAWTIDSATSVAMYNAWYLDAAPAAYAAARGQVVDEVERLFMATDHLRSISPAVIRTDPRILSVLRMCTAPPLARDRLAGLADVSPRFVKVLEEGVLPPRMANADLQAALERICGVIDQLLDVGLFEWLAGTSRPDPTKREIAAVVVGDRRTQALADPVVRNAQETRQLAVMDQWLTAHGYQQRAPIPGQPFTSMAPGTFSFRLNVPVLDDTGKRVNMPIDAVIQPLASASNSMPLLVEAKSAGDYANTNKRRKEEATKIRQLRATYGRGTRLVLFLCGYFDTNYLSYEAAEGLDWIWEHRPDDFSLAGL